MGRLIGLLILFVCMALCFGCKTISKSTIQVNLDATDPEIKTMAVMRFDDEYIQEKGVKGFFIKTISNPDAGEMLADMMTNELTRWGKYHILTRSEIRNKIRVGGDSKEQELVKLRDFAVIRKILKTDAVVIGKIYEFGLVNMPVYERGNVSFVAECIDTRTGKILWSIEANKSVSYKDEVELVSQVIKEAVEKIRKEIES